MSGPRARAGSPFMNFTLCQPAIRSSPAPPLRAMDVVRSNFEEACADLEEHLKSATFVVRPPSSPSARAAHLMPRCTRTLNLSQNPPAPVRALIIAAHVRRWTVR